jgi:Icc protein
MDLDETLESAIAAQRAEHGGGTDGDVAPRLELTTVSTVAATFHEATTATVIGDLLPRSEYEHRGVRFTTLQRPPGELRCRLATVNDVHFGEIEAGRLAASDLGPIQRRRPDATPYPDLMNGVAIAELVASESTDGPLAAVIVKGDLTSEGTAEEFAAFEQCYRPSLGDRLHVVRGNHDAYRGQTDYAGDSWIELPGVAVAVLDTVVPYHSGGGLGPDQLDWLDAHVAAATDPVLVMGHHPMFLGAPGDNPDFILPAHDSSALDELFRRRPAVVAYTAGHTHRHRVQRTASGVPSIEVGCVKDFPGTWAEYQVYEEGLLQIVHRISSPEALAWSEQCRGLYADFGIDYTSYALGRLADRCFEIELR